jgi:Fe-S cluster biogenesis protein NfuA
MEQIEALLREVDQIPDAAAQASARQVIQAVLELHGTAMERMLERIAAAGNAGQSMIDSLAEDELVESVLLLHGLHPLDIETRVRQALDKVRPMLRAHGGNVELLGVADGVVRLRMAGNCNGCASSAATLKLSIEQAIYDKAPDVAGIEVEEGAVSEVHAGNGHARFALPVLQR